MPKLDIEEIKRKGIVVFKTKTELLEFIKKVRFRKDEPLLIFYCKRKWFVRWK